MPNDLSFFQQILDDIAAAIQPGAATARDTMLFFMGVAVLFQLLGVCYAFVWNGTLLQPIAGMLIKTSLVWFLLQSGPTVLQQFQEFFVWLGLQIGGGRLSIAQLLDPGYIFDVTSTVVQPVIDAMSQQFGLRTIGQAFLFLLLWLGFLGAFAVMATNLFIWQVELLIGAAVTLVLFPTLAYQRTAFIGQGSISYLINATFRFCIAAAIASVAIPLTRRLTMTPDQVTFARTAMVVIAAWCISLSYLKVNSMAGRMLAGLPTLSAGDVFSSLMQAGRTAMALTTGGTTMAAASTGAGLLGGARAMGALTSRQQMPLAMHRLGERMGSYAGTMGQVAAHQGKQTLASSARMGRFIGSAGGDAPHGRGV